MYDPAMQAVGVIKKQNCLLCHTGTVKPERLSIDRGEK
jgi:hypothetical protein